MLSSITTEEKKSYRINLNIPNRYLKSILKITSIYCDGHCVPTGDNPKGYARITDQYGNPILHFFEFDDNIKTTKIITPLGELDSVEVYSLDTPQQQINYAESMALYLGLQVAIYLDVGVIYIDSITSNAWSQGRISKNIKDPIKLKICEETTKLRNLYSGNVIMIKGADNKSDFGYHH